MFLIIFRKIQTKYKHLFAVWSRFESDEVDSRIKFGFYIFLHDFYVMWTGRKDER